jgi:hypothetical protein
MKCPRHPERWSKDELDLSELSMALECPDCLEALESQVLSEVESGNVPPVPTGFADRVLDNLDHPLPGAGAQKTSDNLLTFIHYVTAAAVTIAMILSGGFNLVFQATSNYSAAFNRYINDVTAVTTKVSVNNELYQNVRDSLDDLIKSRLNQKTK